MSSLQGLPPLPRSLSGFNLSGGRGESGEPPPPPTRSSSKSQRGGKTSVQSSSRPSPPARQLTTLDTQLAVLRREMVFTQESLGNSLSFSFVNTRQLHRLVTLIEETRSSFSLRDALQNTVTTWTIGTRGYQNTSFPTDPSTPDASLRNILLILIAHRNDPRVIYQNVPNVSCRDSTRDRGAIFIFMIYSIS